MKRAMPFQRVFVAAPAALLMICGISATANADGAGLFAKNCASCHGADGSGDTPVGKAMNVPSLKGAGLAADKVASQVRDSAKHKAASDKLSDEELGAIAKAVAAM